MPNYAQGKVYCLRNSANNGKIVYVGSTTQPLSMRMAQHRKGINNFPNLKIYQLMASVGVNQFHIELIEDVPCERREQLLAREGYYIRLHNLTTGDGCNSVVAGRTNQQYKEEHIEHGRAKSRAYYYANQDACIENNKEWKQANPEKVKATAKEYRLANAEKTKEQSDARSKKWVEANAEKLKAYRIAYREAHREKLNAQNLALYHAKKAAERAAQAPAEVPA